MKGHTNSLPTFTASEVGALPDTTVIPSKISDLTNDSGFTTNTGTITGVTVNGSTVASSGSANIGYVVKGYSGEITQARVVSALPSSPSSTTLYIITG